ncbi:putative formate dehydrogenase oxidoreductase protein [Enhygromyxa salina]|uniref:Putative formate dehydrogenase oxidoreductase protein n=1 Tax=Enhygromyxa salina TaxID=215803 RepID=A0A0C1Z3N5_9BACT|nr:FdhF/YdeP family oxidoreductase [Enhygromyxa salina]KIG12194.1 putative formate dehydrogenase oxidoreductase protein [Enhygromyxa salina]
MTDTPEAPTDLGEVALVAAPAQLPAQLHERALASPLTPLVTAPMTVDPPPRTSGGLPSVAVALDDTLRKVGTRQGLRLLRRVNQDPGFACPGCAWPVSAQPHRIAVCESGVRAIADALGQRRAGPQLFATYTIPELSRRSDHWLNAQGRLTHPMVRRPTSNSYEPITWSEAIELIAAQLRDLPDPNRAVFYSSARVSNEAAFCWQLLARELGTNNLASSSQLCHEASRVALTNTLGSWRGGVTLDDFATADAIFVIGQNPASNHPRMLEALRAAKLRGAKIVAVNPLREVGLVRSRDPRRPRDWFGSGTEISDLLVAVRIGGDLALFEGLCKAVIEAGAVDQAFVDAHTEGFAALESELALRSWDDIVARSGVEREQIQAAANIYIGADKTIACWGVGLTQHRRGVDAIEQLLSLLLLRGNVGKRGAGPLAVLGHSNTAGCWTMGVTARPDDALLAGLERATGVTMPREPGLDVGDSLAAMQRGEIDVLFGLGGNLLSAGPDTEALAAGIRRTRLTVQISTKLNRSHLITGETALILPCLARMEAGEDALQWSSFEDATGRVRASVGQERPVANGLRSEVEILAELGAALAPSSPVRWASLARDHDRIRELIAAGLPDCDAFATELRPGQPLQLSSPTRARRFATASGRAQLTSAPRDPAIHHPEGALLLTSVRSHDQHNTTIYGLGDRERGIQGYRRLVLMNLADMQRLEIDPYEQIELIGHFDGVERRAPKWVVVPHHVRKGCVAAYFPEANVLVPAAARDPRSGTPSFKSVVVTIVKQPVPAGR